MSERFEAERERLHHTETAHLPLAGLAVSVKDLFDVAGQVTTAGSLALQDAPAATSDAPAVARLRAAGGSIVGARTWWNSLSPASAPTRISQRPPRSTTALAPCPGQRGCLAVFLRRRSVSRQWRVLRSVGLRHRGSIRIPAAFNGIVGFKSTARLVPTTGAVPLSTTLDTACAMTRSVRDAIVVHEVLAARRVTRSSPLSAWRLAVPTHTFLDALDGTVSTAFQRTLDLRQAGAQIESIDLPETGELGPMQAQGSLAAAESYAWHRPVLARHAEQYDPRVRSRIERGAAMSAADHIHLQHARQAWISRMEARVAGFDALLSPPSPSCRPCCLT